MIGSVQNMESINNNNTYDGADYELMALQMKSLMEQDRNWLPVLSNASAVLMTSLEAVNWAGFYVLRGDRLVLGPFQGRPACIHIDIGKGVCGTAVQRRQTLVVEDVHQFPGHIACDSASRSEIVVPIFDGDRVAGVLDIDSPVKGRFSDTDREGLESFVKLWRSIFYGRIRKDKYPGKMSEEIAGAGLRNCSAGMIFGP